MQEYQKYSLLVTVTCYPVWYTGIMCAGKSEKQPTYCKFSKLVSSSLSSPAVCSSVIILSGRMSAQCGLVTGNRGIYRRSNLLGIEACFRMGNEHVLLFKIHPNEKKN